jgi:hypothetical protein
VTRNTQDPLATKDHVLPPESRVTSQPPHNPEASSQEKQSRGESAQRASPTTKLPLRRTIPRQKSSIAEGRRQRGSPRKQQQEHQPHITTTTKRSYACPTIHSPPEPHRKQKQPTNAVPNETVADCRVQSVHTVHIVAHSISNPPTTHARRVSASSWAIICLSVES